MLTGFELKIPTFATAFFGFGLRYAGEDWETTITTCAVWWFIFVGLSLLFWWAVNKYFDHSKER